MVGHNQVRIDYYKCICFYKQNIQHQNEISLIIIVLKWFGPLFNGQWKKFHRRMVSVPRYFLIKQSSLFCFLFCFRKIEFLFLIFCPSLPNCRDNLTLYFIFVESNSLWSFCIFIFEVVVLINCLRLIVHFINLGFLTHFVINVSYNNQG